MAHFFAIFKPFIGIKTLATSLSNIKNVTSQPVDYVHNVILYGVINFTTRV